MGWKIFILAISNASNVSTADVQKALKLEALKPGKEISFTEAQFTHSTCIGGFNDQLLIVDENLVFKFSEKEPSEVEKNLVKLFPQSDITVLIYSSTVDLFGYTIIKNGQRLRAKSGADMETYIDSGEKLPEEIEAAKELLIDQDELNEMKKTYSQQQLDTYLDQQNGISTVFKLTKRLLDGKQIDDAASPGGQISLRVYH